MKRYATFLFAAVFFSGGAALAAVRVRAALPATAAQATTQPSAYARLEWVVELDRTYGNPFDPDEISVDATFTGPDGKALVLPAFWFEEFRRESQNNRERLTAAGEPHWRLRFCPTQAGKWQMVVTAKDRNGSAKSDPVEFAVTASKDPGFVRRSPDNSRYFQFDNGQAYFIIGPNVCWTGNQGLGGYEMYFSRLGQAGANYARLWMSSPGVNMETKEAGLGKYDLRGCYFFDQVFEIAARNNLRCMLALNTYGDLTTGGSFNEGRWAVNPYNAANGGPATRPADISTNPVAREMYKRRLRYLIARYSAYTSLGFWEFWNEQDLARGAVPAKWVAEMAAYLKANDPYRHLVTTSFSSPGPAAVWNIPDIDLTQRHIYGGDEPIADLAGQLFNSTRAHDVYNKPHLIGEIGISWKGPDTKFDPNGIGTEFHNSLWASAMSGAAGGSCTWWWDSYLHPKNLYSHYTALAKFAAGIDWPRRAFAPLALQTPVFAHALKEENTGLKVLALASGSDEYLAWLLDPASTCTNDLAGKKPRTFDDAMLTVPVSAAARYKAEWWDTRSGQVVKSEIVSPSDGVIRLAVPAFERDIALRLNKQ